MYNDICEIKICNDVLKKCGISKNILLNIAMFPIRCRIKRFVF